MAAGILSVNGWGRMEQSYQDEQTHIFTEMTRALVEATPEWWSEATLELCAQDGLGSGLAHIISNSGYPRDVVVATDELLAATRALELASTRHGDSWLRCVFRIHQEPAGTWGFVAEFER